MNNRLLRLLPTTHDGDDDDDDDNDDDDDDDDDDEDKDDDDGDDDEDDDDDDDDDDDNDEHLANYVIKLSAHIRTCRLMHHFILQAKHHFHVSICSSYVRVSQSLPPLHQSSYFCLLPYCQSVTVTYKSAVTTVIWRNN